MNSSVTLYDTLTRDTIEVSAQDNKTLRVYCCGPTVYGAAHIGNFRTFVAQDTFRRVCELAGYKTTFVRNITDVDDKTIRVSQEQGMTLTDFTQKWTNKFHDDCEKLNLLTPHVEPGAVDHIPEQIELIEKLIEKGHAYQSDDKSVYFKVSSFEQYGCLSRLKEREITTDSVAIADDEYDKESLADFALWKARKAEDGDNFWNSPWGEGRPGWHLECSAMGMKYLGNSFDLHSGGIDLVFPHHDNEIAQSEAATGEQFARHWFHITHLMVEGAKMSKSLGNLYTLDDLEQKGHSAAELRYTLLSGHYRKQLNFTFQGLSMAKQALDKFARLEAHFLDLDPTLSANYEGLVLASSEIKSELGPFEKAWLLLCDDMNTAGAFGALHTATQEVEKLLAKDGADISALYAAFHFVLSGIGLTLPVKQEVVVPDNILKLAQERFDAKQAKEWARADTLRDELQTAGWKVVDTKDGFEVEPL